MKRVTYGTMFVLLGCIISAQCHGIEYKSLMQMWGVYDYKATSGTAGAFVLAGCVGKSGCKSIVGLVADKIVEHGGYFCPYRIALGLSRFKYYYPANDPTWSTRCAWLCEAGYSGTGCAVQTGTPSYCDTKPYTATSTGKFGDPQTINASVGKTIEISRFASWDFNTLVLGATQFIDHGIIAAPVQLRYGKHIHGIHVYGGNGTTKTLCATGYKPDNNGTKCVPINAEICNTSMANLSMCYGFSKSDYNSKIHYLVNDGGCAKFFCSEVGTAFAQPGQYECQPCPAEGRNGIDPASGVCIKCNSGQAFDSTSNQCVTARPYTHTDLQYGIGQTSGSTALKNQCWTYTEPDEYKNCVMGNNSIND